MYQESYNVPDFNNEAYLWQIHSVATELHIQRMEESINFCLIHIDDNTVIFHCGACNRAKKHCMDACGLLGQMSVKRYSGKNRSGLQTVDYVFH